MPDVWELGNGKAITLDQPRLVAILNITPDSFYEASRRGAVDDAVRAAAAFVAEGAAMLDVGGESTRPGAERVSAEEQITRIVPVIEAIRRAPAPLANIPLSVDTTLAGVARAAIRAGADAINDVSGGEDDPAILTVAAESGAGLVLMHRYRRPSDDSYSDRYSAAPRHGAVADEVIAMLTRAAESALARGVRRGAIVLDPGLGFGKTVEQNLELLHATPRLRATGYPVLSALSRKSFVGRVSLGRDSSPQERLAGTLVCSLKHAQFGASLFRVHDVAEHAAAFRTATALATPQGAVQGQSP